MGEQSQRLVSRGWPLPGLLAHVLAWTTVIPFSAFSSRGMTATVSATGIHWYARHGRLSAAPSAQRDSSATGTTRIPPRRIMRTSGCTYRSKLESDIPRLEAASSRVSATRGTGEGIGVEVVLDIEEEVCGPPLTPGVIFRRQSSSLFFLP